MSSMPKVWLIGANSFTGLYLAPTLEHAGYQVVTDQVDLQDVQQVEQAMLQIQPDYIVNLAALSFVPDGGSADIYAVNTFGPQNILDACLKLAQAPKSIILASTSLVYGAQTAEIINEDCPVNPVNHYGCSKWAMEQIAKTYSDKLNIIITRPFNYTGTGQADKFLIPKIVQHFKQKAKTIQLGNIDIWRDFSDVRWVVQAYTALLALPQDQTIKTVNLCSGKLLSIRSIIEALEQLTDHKIQIEMNPEFVRATDIQRQRGDNSHLYASVKGLQTPIEFKQTLSWMLAN
ncbi:MAG: NAD-dependent epimerase/dehydratase family protein [Gammaproteobacteria bacterium]|nr:NAD-dependent epimerase/dehydratase family protein [Gammaproteobacteria bacterium]MBT5965871.1 NAD-dependent epimerase/dehydratase family protein [Gammaproteobacteria bacterium]